MFCVNCKANTKNIRGEGSHLNEDPQWTIGCRPLIVESALFCRRCDDFSGFIPVAENIPSILRKNLMNIVKRWVWCRQPILAKILDTWCASSRIYRNESNR
jgi:hypothetical protein